ncbi:MAG TPA: bifunctional 5,10-methylenetetrahydrofolate dehydrogenase/5,10-methenyltetrahydrofolate cyclohydrolase [Saprospiraceae bacterium]|nr:bifunctional 5,10-methylenetetrahydrofolate dehydrogenase/5,10-methenyltetrahydrofolate cyclohydrolase [Saprospiraceae bacterium]
MQLLDGVLVAKKIKADLLQLVKAEQDKGKRVPHLAAVLIGDHPASASYIKNKIRSCAEAGYESTLIHRDSSITKEGLLEIVDGLNRNEAIDGYIVQLPLPRHIDEQEILLAIDPKKDVDGFHPMNIGRMVIGLPAYVPATPLGILKLIEHYRIPTEGKHVVVIGRSNIVGTPVSLLLSRKAYPGNATVTLCHSKSTDLAEMSRKADILIAAIGTPHFVKADMIKDGAAVIDVGMNQIADPASKKGHRLVGDVDFEGVSRKAAYLTPVPGGVGPMTVCALMINTWTAYTGKIYG